VKKNSKTKTYSTHQLLWPDLAKRYGLTPAIVFGTIYWYAALSDAAVDKGKGISKLGYYYPRVTCPPEIVRL